MIRTILAAASLIALALPAAAQTGYMTAQCQVLGAPAQLALQYEAIGGTGIVTDSGGGITGVISDGSSTYYWNGTLTGSFGELPISGENYFLRFYDQNAYNRETVLEVTVTGPESFYLQDVYGNYPGQHPCEITAFE